MRTYLNEHPYFTTVLLTLIMCVGIWGVWVRAESGEIEGKCWYLEEGSGEVFMGRIDEIPPIVGPSGGDAVRIEVLRCRDGSRFVGWLEKYSMVHKKRLEQMRDAKGGVVVGFKIEDSEIAIRMRGLGGKWVSSSSRVGKTLLSDAKGYCRRARVVYPKRGDDLFE